MSQPAGRPAADLELRELIAAMCNGTATPAERDRLEQLLADNEDAQFEYLSFAEVHAAFLWQHRGQTDDILALVAEAEENDGASGFRVQGSGSGIRDSGFGVREPDLSVPSPESRAPSPEPLILPIIIDTSSAAPSPLFSTLFAPGSPLFSYTAATVITGAIILIFWMWKVSLRCEVAESPRPATPPPASREVQPVGRITGTADCHWADPNRAPKGTAVSLGHKYALNSGLMEIAYDSGATVILQGPCTYEVESAAGGYLSLGKLTARVEKSEIRNPKSEISTPQSLIPNPLFVVRTPTAIVTDLGTEFGVEVTRDGRTDAHVFRGAVRVETLGGGDSGNHGQVCREGEAVRVGAGESVIRPIAVGKSTAAPAFVRAMPPPQAVRESQAYADLVLSLKPAVYYRMERPAGEKDRFVVLDSAPGGHHGELRLGEEPGTPYVPGRFGDAIWLRGPGVRDRVIVPDYPKAADDRLSVVAWVLATGKPQWAMIASNWGVPAGGRENTGQFHLGLFELRGDLAAHVTQRDGQVVEVREGEAEPLPVNAWQHVALVADGTTLHLYRNGKEVASAPCAGVLPRPPTASLGIGCRTNHAGTDAYMIDNPVKSYNYYAWFWPGRIDELAIFNHAPVRPKHRATLFRQAIPTAERRKNRRKRR